MHFFKKIILAVSMMALQPLYGHLKPPLAEKDLEEPTTRSLFPPSITLLTPKATYTLQTTGAAVHNKLLVKIYTLVHYIEEPIVGTIEEVLNQVFNDNKPKQLSFRWLRSLELRQVRDSYWEAFDKVLNDDDQYALQNYIDQFVGLYDQDAQKEATHEVRWLPGGLVELWIQGKKKGAVQNIAFAKALWSVWFGPKSIVDREKLLEKMIKRA